MSPGSRTESPSGDPRIQSGASPERALEAPPARGRSVEAPAMREARPSRSETRAPEDWRGRQRAVEPREAPRSPAAAPAPDVRSERARPEAPPAPDWRGRRGVAPAPVPQSEAPVLRRETAREAHAADAPSGLAYAFVTYRRDCAAAPA